MGSRAFASHLTEISSLPDRCEYERDCDRIATSLPWAPMMNETGQLYEGTSVWRSTLRTVHQYLPAKSADAGDQTRTSPMNLSYRTTYSS